MEQPTLERLLIRCRYLFTRGAVARLGLRDLSSIEASQDVFVRECHSVYKKAQALLIDAMTEINSDIERATAKDRKSPLIGRYIHCLRVLESCYESFVWLALRPCDVPHLYKGPKFGSLTAQNIDSVLRVMRQLNASPYAFAVPLDYTRFTCTGDLLNIERQPGAGSRIAIVEVKEGTVNDAMLDALKARDESTWARFLDDFGKKGFDQVRRFIKQNQEYFKREARMKATTGIHEDEDGTRIVIESDTRLEHYIDVVEGLCRKARKGEYAVDVVDECLMVAAVDTSTGKRCALGEFDARLFVHNAFVGTQATSRLSPDDLNAELGQIRLTDWLEGLGSICLVPLFMRPLRARNFLDLAFGRSRLRLFFHAPAFVDLCRRSGVQAGFLSKKETNRVRSTQKWRDGDYPLFAGRAITYQIGSDVGILGSARLHEVLFNWVRPRSIVNQLADANTGSSELRDGGGLADPNS